MAALGSPQRATRPCRTGSEVLDLLNQGEAVHSLQRAIHNGMITAKQGRTTEELGTISGALTLLANIVMAWNTIISRSCSTEHPAIIPMR